MRASWELASVSWRYAIDERFADVLMNDEEPLTPLTPAAVPLARQARARHFLPYLVFLLVGLWCAFYPMLLSAFRRMEVNTGDTPAAELHPGTQLLLDSELADAPSHQPLGSLSGRLPLRSR